MKIKITFWRVIALLILLAGLYATFLRFTRGLGAVTNLSDQFPWGLWIGFDVLVGVGLAAGGFTIAAIVHIFNIETYESISRPTLLTAFLGYLLVATAIMFDIGQPHRIWHPIIMWNPHSVMFEVAWCVTLYLTVLALEFSPIVFEKFNLNVPLKVMRTIYLPLVILGVLLSMLHQSSLGTVYVIVPDKLYGLWYSPMLPIFFFISAISVGLAMTIFESFLSYRAFGKRLELNILVGLARVLVVILAVYLILKFQDLRLRGNLPLVFQLTEESVLFWGEIGLGVFLPMILLFIPQVRVKRAGLFFSALLVIMGFILNRLNVSITGMLHNETYFPKWTEVAITLSFVTVGFIVFALAVKYLDIFPTEEIDPHNPPPLEQIGLSGRVILGMWGVVLAGFIIYGLAKDNRLEHPVEAAAIERKTDPLRELEFTNLPADIVYDKSDMGTVTFSHETHLLLVDNPQCQPCHPKLYDYNITPKQQTPLVGDVMHESQSCGHCHNGTMAFSIEEECTLCHVE
ncbi:MAG: Ni/Fe-hydrogenase cytochrome b subunit [Gemmatimonadetes bacterium]|nr:MAG: Ni/Fe-hydrogenase cytochrome b subunit [Gemmatimonadota bacterium]